MSKQGRGLAGWRQWHASESKGPTGWGVRGEQRFLEAVAELRKWGPVGEG